MKDTNLVDWSAVVANLKAENEELKYRCERMADENSKLGLQYEQLLKEKSDLDRHMGYLEGQVEAYRFIWSCGKGRDKNG